MNKDKSTIAWFSVKCKPRKDLVTLDFYKNNALILDALIVSEPVSAIANVNKKKMKNKWPGTIFLKTHLVKGNLKNEVKEFVFSAPFFSKIHSYGKGYNAKPIFFSDKNIQDMLKKNEKIEKKTTKFTFSQINFKINDFVTILTGSFRGYEGEVIEIDYATGIITLSIEFFGRTTPVQVNFNECKKIVD